MATKKKSKKPIINRVIGRPAVKNPEPIIINIKDWLKQSIRVIKPPEKLSVSQWADKYRVLDSKTSAEPGQWSTSRTPYLKGIMDAFKDPEIEEIIFAKPTQVGGTECLLNIIGYIICQDQNPALVVYPTLELAESISKNRIQPMINASPSMKEHYYEDSSKMLEMQFDGMYMVLSGANSPSSLASRPIRYLLLDEVDKFPQFAGKEADPISLARERTKTFPHNKKIILTSTPTFKEAHIWQAWERADSQLKYYVPCPHCGVFQTFKLPQIKWNPEAKNPDEVRQAAYYECQEQKCKGIITDSHKQQMLKLGAWKAEKDNGKRKTAFHLNAIYSPWLRFGDIAYEFKKSKGYKELLMNFINSWLAEPWEQTEIKMASESILKNQSDYEEGIIPNEAILLTGGVDVQQDCFYWTIRAWGYGGSSWNIGHGQVYDWSEIEYIMNMPFYDNNGKSYQVNLCGIDSGNDTDTVYEFCAINQDWAIPVKGSSTPILSRYRASIIDKQGSSANGLRLYLVDGAQYKDMISSRIKRNKDDKGAWLVYKGCDLDYAEQICSEEKISVKRGGRDVFIWKPKTSHAKNHYLDCEVYASLCADLLHVRYLQPEKFEDQPIKKELNNNIKKDNYNNNSWINTSGSWLK